MSIFTMKSKEEWGLPAFRTWDTDKFQAMASCSGFAQNNQAEVLKGVITALGIKGGVTLVGHDHGGGVCQILRLNMPAISTD